MDEEEEADADPARGSALDFLSVCGVESEDAGAVAESEGELVVVGVLKGVWAEPSVACAHGESVYHDLGADAEVVCDVFVPEVDAVFGLEPHGSCEESGASSDVSAVGDAGFLDEVLCDGAEEEVFAEDRGEADIECESAVFYFFGVGVGQVGCEDGSLDVAHVVSGHPDGESFGDDGECERCAEVVFLSFVSACGFVAAVEGEGVGEASCEGSVGLGVCGGDADGVLPFAEEGVIAELDGVDIGEGESGWVVEQGGVCAGACDHIVAHPCGSYGGELFPCVCALRVE